MLSLCNFNHKTQTSKPSPERMLIKFNSLTLGHRLQIVEKVNILIETEVKYRPNLITILRKLWVPILLIRALYFFSESPQVLGWKLRVLKLLHEIWLIRCHFFETGNQKKKIILLKVHLKLLLKKFNFSKTILWIIMVLQKRDYN